MDNPVFTTENIIILLSELFYFACEKFSDFFRWLFQTSIGDLVSGLSGTWWDIPIIVAVLGSGLTFYLGFQLTKWAIDILP